MKKKISRIWGVGLTLMMVVSLLLWAAPISADNTLQFDAEDPPDELLDNDILDIAVAEGGVAVYVVDGTEILQVSTDTGVSWEDARIRKDTTYLYADLIAVAPDDPQYIAAANATIVYISDDSGATWDTLDEVSADIEIYDIALSVEGSSRFVAVAGVAATTNASVWYYEIGAIGADWEEISLLEIEAGEPSGWVENEGAYAVEFSPNFVSDEILAVVSANTSTTDDINFQVFSFNTDTWNGLVGDLSDDYPLNLNIEGETLPAGLDSASIALSPDYLGSEGDLRQAFVGIATTATDATQADGIFFCDDDSVDAVKDKEFIHSVDFDGTNLVAGSFDSTTVFRSSNPLEGDDADVDDSAGKKSPGGTGLTVVAFAGGDVIAGTSGDENGIAVSNDDGKTFNDISMIDTLLTAVVDTAVSPDGSRIYLLTADGTGDDDLSLWRLDDDDWVRVLSRQDEENASNFVVRVAPDDMDVVYLAETGGSTIYYSADAGEARWQTRTARYPIVDLAVETDGGIAYILTDSGYVSKSVNTGFTWGGKETTGQAGSNMIVSLSEDMVLVGGDTGYVSYSTDGNENWTDLDDSLGSAAIQVTASGLDDGDFIYAASTAGDNIYRWELGEDDEWDDFYDEVATGDEFTGLALGAGGVLYALAYYDTANTSTLYRFLDPTDGDVSIETASLVGIKLNKTPTALRTSAGSTVLWAIGVDTEDGDVENLYSYEDTIGVVAPALKAPASGYTVKVNPVSGESEDVNLTWESPSDEITDFDLEVALDEDFDELLFAPDFTADSFDEGDLVNFLLTANVLDLMPDNTYYWHVRVTEDGPLESPWSETWSFTVEEAEGLPPITVEIPPTPEVTVTVPAPQVTVTVPPVVTVPPAPAPAAGWALITIIVIGALLVIALIVLILRTRRVV